MEPLSGQRLGVQPCYRGNVFSLDARRSSCTRTPQVETQAVGLRGSVTTHHRGLVDSNLRRGTRVDRRPNFALLGQRGLADRTELK